ncbi:DUF3352 domain-containing protein [Pedobacter sp. MC2016-24]|uniref:DUF3352 domain-containing protein n=1 Tax=Pedobacter sp. MC2016-24 TaxID=2780090 RepID=UPI001882CB7E|nr:DUF3352 domain-containing protein [Pedobacter sp. MC2016-24]MBE9600052.1 hypothetical protein [Pedobacter sp. MC2016-24]
MKKIVISIVLLLVAIIAMAYLYFSNLNADRNTSDISLHAATANSAFVFSFQNDKTVLDLLKSQELFKNMLGPDKYKQLSAIKTQLMSMPLINQATDQEYVYISFLADQKNAINFLVSTQINSQLNGGQILQAIQKSGIQTDTLQGIFKLSLPDSTLCYLGIKENLVLLSNAAAPIADLLKKPLAKQNNDFANYIRANSRFAKNSLAQLYINFNKVPVLLQAVIHQKLTGELQVFHQQNAFAALNYSYSNKNILFTGSTDIQANNYYQLFANTTPQKVTITNILPENTANYTVYGINNYQSWRKELQSWFLNKKEAQVLSRELQNISNKYHLNTDDIFPKYFDNQLITFQLSTAEKLGAINLKNGDKTAQLLLDLSEDYNENIKRFKEPDLLYAYFGQPFMNFKAPYYVILDNYLVFANQPATLQNFLSTYENNKLLIGTEAYINASNQLPDNSSICFYLDKKNALNLLKSNLRSEYYQYTTDEKGLKKYNSLTYQLSGDHGKFQTNILIHKQTPTLEKDSLAL